MTAGTGLEKRSPKIGWNPGRYQTRGWTAERGETTNKPGRTRGPHDT